MRRRIGVLALSFVLGVSIAHAQVVIYRCTNASGEVTLQNGTPCPKGTRQQKKVMETPAPTVTAPVIAPSAPAEAAHAPPPEPPEPEPVVAPKQPPPALFECETWNGDHYLGETAQPPARCAPLQVTGLDGTGAMAGGAACQMMEDRCRPVADAALCDAWKQRVRQLDATATFGGDTVPPAEAERIRRVAADSACAP